MSFDAGAFARDLALIKNVALMKAAQDYIGQAAGSSPGVAPASKVDFRNRFTRTNTHGFAALSNKPRFVVVRKKNGKWIGFSALGYADWKKKRFGNKPILVRTGTMVQELRRSARVVMRGTGSSVHSVAVFRLSPTAWRHFTGAGNLQRRDPVSPNVADKAAFRERAIQIFKAELQRLKARYGK